MTNDNSYIDPATGALIIPGHPERCHGSGDYIDEAGQQVECCCDECDHLLDCMASPEWKQPAVQLDRVGLLEQLMTEEDLRDVVETFFHGAEPSDRTEHLMHIISSEDLRELCRRHKIIVDMGGFPLIFL